ncbi:hypothetical protein A2755_00100 [Candidatus Wolfebacteria bacterium RIFCSPHIGHO2_01_FULL_48_22]|uniref:Uncharacterized protein n=1 Tax=Candidatus Wolfebacteria bacterium RIFCSPHIGHO2_01_FULL_48_22 TaxID=1802555 RepID=A0A1F8DPE3_9BACT|nr:MAG: hypothetical protein A2755_00100 [Candidatus Wolfebacteria bacterium RIFCSPHIGHO2_01_FULL_48_22]
MYERILHFIKYNNAFTIILVIGFFGFGISFAASSDVRDAVYASEETVISVDNSSVVSADLDNFNFNLRIDSVTEDEKSYYATYSYQTLAILDGVWQNKNMEKTLTVSKEALDGKDFGLYLAKELGENINYELSYLKRVQILEREKGDSQKVVTVEYSGLVGKFFDPKEIVIEGYTPVIPEAVPEVPATVESNPEQVIVSTPYTESQVEPEQLPQTPVEPVPATPPQVEPGPEAPATSTPPQIEPEPVLLPEPEDMVDEELIQEVVGELLQNEASPTPPETTPETTPESVAPAPEAVQNHRHKSLWFL